MKPNLSSGLSGGPLDTQAPFLSMVVNEPLILDERCYEGLLSVESLLILRGQVTVWYMCGRYMW